MAASSKPFIQTFPNQFDRKDATYSMDRVFEEGFLKQIRYSFKIGDERAIRLNFLTPLVRIEKITYFPQSDPSLDFTEIIVNLNMLNRSNTLSCLVDEEQIQTFIRHLKDIFINMSMCLDRHDFETGQTEILLPRNKFPFLDDKHPYMMRFYLRRWTRKSKDLLEWRSYLNMMKQFPTRDEKIAFMQRTSSIFHDNQIRVIMTADDLKGVMMRDLKIGDLLVLSFSINASWHREKKQFMFNLHVYEGFYNVLNDHHLFYPHTHDQIAQTSAVQTLANLSKNKKT